MADTIRLIHINNGETLYGELDRSFLDKKLDYWANWAPGYNYGAITLCKLISKIDCITINRDMIATQDENFILYKIIGEEKEHRLNFDPTLIPWLFVSQLME